MHIVTVFSALPRTGKTTLAFELACRLARNGNHVIALDLAPDAALTRRLLGGRAHLRPLSANGRPPASAFTVFEARWRNGVIRSGSITAEC